MTISSKITGRNDYKTVEECLADEKAYQERLKATKSYCKDHTCKCENKPDDHQVKLKQAYDNACSAYLKAEEEADKKLSEATEISDKAKAAMKEYSEQIAKLYKEAKETIEEAGKAKKNAMIEYYASICKPIAKGNSSALNAKNNATLVSLLDLEELFDDFFGN